MTSPVSLGLQNKTRQVPNESAKESELGHRTRVKKK
jgi:hypothetical protein